MYNKNIYGKGMVIVIIVCIFFGTGIAVPNINGVTEESCNDSYIPSCTNNNSQTFYYGLVSPPDDIVPDNIGKIGTFPPSWDWRNAEHNGKVGDWCTPVRNQRSCGSCWAFSAIGALEAIINIREGSPSLDIDLSEQQLLSCPPDSGGCNGWSSYQAYEFLLNNGGSLPESCFPYQADDTIPCSDRCNDWSEKLIPVSGLKYYENPSVDQLKSKLVNDGPLSVGFDVYEDFSAYTGGVYRHQSGEYTDGHGVVLVGYDDSESCWICKNSWGPDWGENGYFRIGYGECRIEEETCYIDFNPETVNWPPVAYAGELLSGDIEEPIQFYSDKSYDVDSNIINYQWDFGDGTTSSEPNPIHAYGEKGIYNVCLTVTDEEGQHDSDETAVFIEVWDVDDCWIYDVNFKTTLEGSIPASLEIYLDTLKVKVIDETHDTYTVEVKGNVKGDVEIGLNDLIDFPIPLTFSGKLRRSKLDGTVVLDKTGFGLQQVSLSLKGSMWFRIKPLPVLLPAPYEISITASFNSACPLFGFAPGIGKSWDMGFPVFDLEVETSLMYGIISPSFSVDNASIPLYYFSHDCVGEKQIVVEAGTFDVYEIEILDGMIQYFYAPEINNVAKFYSHEDLEILQFYGELISLEESTQENG